MTLKKINQGEIWLANLNPRKGTEPGKNRSVLIIQNQTLLDVAHPSTLIIPLTTHLIDNAHPLRMRVPAQENLKEDSDLLIDQIRAIDNKRLIEGPLTQLTNTLMTQVFQYIDQIMGNLIKK